jgi:hypothetical protein
MVTNRPFDRSGGHDRHGGCRRVAWRRPAVAFAFAAVPLLCSCADAGRTPDAGTPPPGSARAGDSTNACRAGDAACPIPVQLGSQPQWLEGNLTPDEPSRTYRFCIGLPASLAWQWQGAAVHLVLQDPRDGAQGPGLPNPVALPVEGCYRLGVSADTMADVAFGSFRLSLQLAPPASKPVPGQP